MFDFIRTRNLWFTISGLLMIGSIVFLSLGGLKLGIDFTGGTLMRVRFLGPRPSVESINQNLGPLELGSVVVQPVGELEINFKLPHLSNEQRNKILEQMQLLDAQSEEVSFQTIGPAIGNELKQKSQTAILLVLIAIILYITFAFRQVSSGPVPSWMYGLAAIIALFHDILITVGVFAALGYFAGVEVDVLFVTALLTILGFSVHDTIVVFDRIRERIRISHAMTFAGVINESIGSTIARSLNTSLTTLLVLVALLLFGGRSIQLFVLALILGITFGTYSSIFIASPLLIVFERLKHRRG